MAHGLAFSFTYIFSYIYGIPPSFVPVWKGAPKAKHKFKTHYNTYFILQKSGCTILPGGKRGRGRKWYGMVKFEEEFMKDMKPELELEGAVGVCTVEKTGG